MAWNSFAVVGPRGLMCRMVTCHVVADHFRRGYVAMEPRDSSPIGVSEK